MKSLSNDQGDETLNMRRPCVVAVSMAFNSASGILVRAGWSRENLFHIMGVSCDCTLIDPATQSKYMTLVTFAIKIESSILM